MQITALMPNTVFGIIGVVAVLLGRETIGRVAAGAFAAKILEQMGITVFAYTRSIGPIDADPANITGTLPAPPLLPCRMQRLTKKACAYLHQARENCDSVGGCMECLVEVFPPESETLFCEKLDANLAKAIMSIGVPVKAVELGDGAEAAPIPAARTTIPSAWRMVKLSRPSNHSGGTLGGMSDGSPLLIRAT